MHAAGLTHPLIVKLTRLTLAALFALLALPAMAVSAHSGVQSYVYLSLFDDSVEGRVEYPIPDLEILLDIDLPNAQSTFDDLSDSNRAAIVDYTRDHIEISDDAGPWELDFDGTISYLPAANVGYVLVHFDVVDDFDAVPRRWTVTYDGVIESNPERDALFLVENDWRSGTFQNEGEHLLGFSVGNETQLVEVDSVSAVESLSKVAMRGSTSADQAALVLAAVIALLSASVLSGARRPDASVSDDSRPTDWRATLAEVATRFGLVILFQTCSIAAIGLAEIEMGRRLITVIGAIAMLIAAATWWIRGPGARVAAVGVGVLSGIVIGDPFIEQLLHRSAPIRSLIAFELGAAVTTTVVVALLLPLALIIRRTRAAVPVGTVVAGLIAVGGLALSIAATSGARYWFPTVEQPLADAVTSPLVVPIVTAVVALVVFLPLQPSRSQPRHDEAETEPVEVP